MRIEVDAIWLYTLCKETSYRLDRLTKLAEEGKCLDEASSFARWLQFSRVLDLCALYSSPAAGPLKLDGSAIRSKVTNLVLLCGDHYGGGKLQPRVSSVNLDSLHDKVDQLLGLVDMLSGIANTPGAASLAVPGVLACQNLAERFRADFASSGFGRKELNINGKVSSNKAKASRAKRVLLA